MVSIDKILEKYEVDISAFFFCRFAGGVIMGAVLMQLIYSL